MVRLRAAAITCGRKHGPKQDFGTRDFVAGIETNRPAGTFLGRSKAFEIVVRRSVVEIDRREFDWIYRQRALRKAGRVLHPFLLQIEPSELQIGFDVLGIDFQSSFPRSTSLFGV